MVEEGATKKTFGFLILDFKPQLLYLFFQYINHFLNLNFQILLKNLILNFKLQLLCHFFLFSYHFNNFNSKFYFKLLYHFIDFL